MLFRYPLHGSLLLDLIFPKNPFVITHSDFSNILLDTVLFLSVCLSSVSTKIKFLFYFISFLFFLFFKIYLYCSPFFSHWPSPSRTHPSQPSPHYCWCPWAMHISSLVSPRLFSFFSIVFFPPILFSIIIIIYIFFSFLIKVLHVCPYLPIAPQIKFLNSRNLIWLAHQGLIVLVA